MEFQVVLLAGSQGNRLYPLCEETPPCLLTIATRPLLHFQLDHLERAGFTSVIVVTRTSYVRQLTASLDQWRLAKAPPIPHLSTSLSPPLSHAQRSSASTSTLPTTSPTSSTSSLSSTSSSPPSSSSPFHIHLEHVDPSLWSPCSALRHLRPLLHTDFFCIMADLITTIPLHHLADLHRSRDAALTALLLDQSRAREAAAAAVVKKKRDREEEEGDHDTHYIGIAPDSPHQTHHHHHQHSQHHANPTNSLLPALPPSPSPSSRLLYYKSALDIDQEQLTLPKPLLRRAHQLTLHSSLKDAHLYLFAHWLLNLLDAQPLMASVQADLVPYLVKSQHRPSMRRYLEEGEGGEEWGSGGGGESLALLMSHSAPHRDADEVYRCYVSVSSDEGVYCRRATSVAAYREMNTEVAMSEDDELTGLLGLDNGAAAMGKAHPRAQLGQSWLGVGVVLPGDAAVAVRRSVVGRGVRVGVGVKVNGSIIADGVTLEDGVVVTDSVLSEHCSVGRGSSLVNCKVAPRYAVQPHSEHKNEVLAHERSS